MRRDLDPASSSRRIIARAALLLVAALGGAIALPRLLAGVGPAAAPPAAPERVAEPSRRDAAEAAKARLRLGEAQRVWRDAATIAPGEARTDASGESVRWFQGFGVGVESTPSAARVLVNGGDVGETPLVASVKCAPGERVEVEVRKASYAPQRRETSCRADTLVELTVRLHR